MNGHGHKTTVSFVITVVVGLWLVTATLIENPLAIGVLLVSGAIGWLLARSSGIPTRAEWRWTGTIAGPLALTCGAAMFLVVARDNTYALLIVATALIYATIALGNNLTTGLLGALDLSAAGILAIGAYAAAILNISTGLSAPWTLLAGGLSGALAGVVISMATVRMRGNQVAMATLAVTLVVHALLVNLQSLTGGPDGIGSVRSWHSHLPWIGIPRGADFLVAAAIFICAWFAFRNLRRSRHWRAWVALGDDEPAATACGINPASAYRSAFMLSGTIVGLAGAAYAHIQQHIAPGNFGVITTVMVVCAVILGGRGGLSGPAIAAVALWILPEKLHFAHFARMLLFGALLLAILRFRPSGLIPMRPTRHRRQERTAEQAAPREPSNGAVLRVESLTMKIGDFMPVSAVSFETGRGQCLAITGPNGSGKTLTVDMLTGFLHPTEGSCLLGEKRIDGLAPYEVARLGVGRTFQETRLFARMSVLEHALVGLYADGRASVVSAMLRLPAARREEAEHLAVARRTLVLFDPDRFPPRENDLATDFSFGNRRRIEIVRCLASPTLCLLVLDEPFVGMPAEDVRRIGAMLREQMADGMLIMVEHRLSAVGELADGQLHLVAGRVVRAPGHREGPADSHGGENT